MVHLATVGRPPQLSPESVHRQFEGGELVRVGGLRADPQVAGADWWPILVGTLGSLLLVVGSYSVGWLASAISLERRYSWRDWCAAAARWRNTAWVLSGTSLI